MIRGNGTPSTENFAGQMGLPETQQGYRDAPVGSSACCCHCAVTAQGELVEELITFWPSDGFHVVTKEQQIIKYVFCVFVCFFSAQCSIRQMPGVGKGKDW